MGSIGGRWRRAISRGWGGDLGATRQRCSNRGRARGGLASRTERKARERLNCVPIAPRGVRGVAVAVSDCIERAYEGKLPRLNRLDNNALKVHNALET